MQHHHFDHACMHDDHHQDIYAFSELSHNDRSRGRGIALEKQKLVQESARLEGTKVGSR